MQGEDTMNIPTVKIRNILFPTDLSDNARYAFAYAVSLANLYKAKITLLHVLPKEQKDIEDQISGYVMKEKWEEIKISHYQQTKASLTGKLRQFAQVREIVDPFSESDSASESADEIVVVHGKPAKEILHQLDKRNCDLIVLGSRSPSTLAGTIMGGVAEKVLAQSPVPVLIVRLPEG
jgi:nucleotide-binding universal stress UspA family protein